MKPVWKWIIGIVVGLIVVAVLVGAAFLVHGFLMSGHSVATLRIPAPNTGQGPQGNQPRRFGMPGNGMPYNGKSYNGMPGFGWHRHGMMGFGPMMAFGGMIFGLLCLGGLVLLVIGIVWLVRRPTAVQPVAAPVLHACPKCEKPVQADWNNCPYCGKKL